MTFPVETDRWLIRKRTRHSELFFLRFPPEQPGRDVLQGLDRLGAFSSDGEVGDAAAIVYERVLPDEVSVETAMANRWVLAIPDAPRVPNGRVTAGEPLPSEQFWPLMSDLQKRHNGFVALMTLRQRLAKLDPADVLAFQFSLVNALTAMRPAYSEWSWGRAAWNLISGGEDAYQQALAGDPRGTSGVEFEVVTDVAESVLGVEIDVPGFGASRDQDRQRVEREALLAKMAESWSAQAAGRDSDPREWWLNPHHDYWRVHWHGWRAVLQRPEGRVETLVLGSRRYNERIADAAERARALLVGRGEVVGDLEMADVETIGAGLNVEPGAWTPQIYTIQRPGGRNLAVDLDDYRRKYGY